MPYNSTVARPPYYKQPITTLPQLQRNIIRMQYDTRMDGSTKEKYVRLMFESYVDNAHREIIEFVSPDRTNLHMTFKTVRGE